MKNATAFILLLAALLAPPPRDARACSCIATSLGQQLEYADYAFAGTVLDVVMINGTSPDAYLVATIAVDQVWKGDVTATFQVRTPRSSASCGYTQFKVGERFVLFAYEVSDEAGQAGHAGLARTYSCGRNMKYSHAGEDLDKLGPGADPLPAEGHYGASGFSVDAPHPHPITSQTTLLLSVDRAQFVTVEVFDALGRRTNVLFDGALPAGAEQSLTFDAGDLPSGFYLIHARGESATEVRTVIIQR